MSKKVIVTGGTGYIGSHTVVELIAAGYEPVILDNLSNSKLSVLEGIKRITGLEIPFEKINLTDADATKAYFKKHDDALGVVHFAALKSVGESVQKPLLYYHNNLTGLMNVLKGMRANKIQNLIFSSSCTVYGQPKKLPVTENSPIQAAESPYGNTKQIGEKIIKEDVLSRTDGTKAIALRYFNPIGAHASAHIGELPLGIPTNLVPYITQTAIGLREELHVFGNDYNTKDGTAIRDYLHVVDLASAHVLALKRLKEDRQNKNFEVYNLGTGRGNTVLEVIHAFERSTSIKLKYKFVARRPGDIEATYADTSLAQEKLAWTATLNLDDMMSSAWKWQTQLDS